MNNKYRNNNNQIYSLNYKFDSTSIAGKISGTALDLIKKYNELAKEAHGNGNYVEMEVFRQYAEHYRKIVTEINEKKIRIRTVLRKSVLKIRKRPELRFATIMPRPEKMPAMLSRCRLPKLLFSRPAASLRL